MVNLKFMSSIKGIIRNTYDVPLKDVNVMIVKGPPHSDIVAVTGDNGTFEFGNLRPGNYVMKAYGETESDDIPVRVLFGKKAFVEIWLEETDTTDLRDGEVNEENNVIDEI